ncbi:hypothetical protein RND71_001833 [Anisodus tanguticus]|uniref:MSP domain-containing protein n=1 Tax=Anisodus tanguticus TaxID=243964 RepID=A0AAE1T371_9SOLA|nr:hypothetical protein RND71_001833 [Anisodus tanguticus]
MCVSHIACNGIQKYLKNNYLISYALLGLIDQKVEVKKQSSCAIHIANITDQYVAFKVKTTSPKKYCVRPNIGVIKPKSTYDFTVTIQAQRTAPSDMQCKDKFLIQCTVVPFGTSEEEIPPSMPANGISKQGASIEISMQQEKFPSGVENLPPAQTVVKNNKDIKFEEETEEPRLGKIADVKNLNFAKNTESNNDEVVENNKGADFDAEEEEPRLAKTMEDVKLNSPKKRESNTSEVVKLRYLNMETKLSLSKYVEELKCKINSLDSQLIEAECIIAKFKEEKRSTTVKDMEILKRELVNEEFIVVDLPTANLQELGTAEPFHLLKLNC